jgi:hypothetical protein
MLFRIGRNSMNLGTSSLRLVSLGKHHIPMSIPLVIALHGCWYTPIRGTHREDSRSYY